MSEVPTIQIDIPTNNLIFPPCMKCSSLPLLELNINKIIIKCQNCKISEESLESYSKKMRELSQSPKCKNDSSDGTDFCTKCRSWLCPDCSTSHQRKNKDHKLITFYDYFEFYCEHDKVTLNKYYCLTCKKHFCPGCTKYHKNHNIIKVEEIFTEKKINDFRIELQKTKKEYFNYAKEIYSKAKAICSREIELIEKKGRELYDVYEKNLKNSKEIFSFMELLLNSYDKKIHNYKFMNNIFNNSKLKLCRVEDFNFDKLAEPIDNVTNYFKNYTVFPIKRINLSLLKNVFKIHDNDEKIGTLCYLGSGKLASCSDDNTIKIYNLFEKTCEYVLIGHTGSVSFVCQAKKDLLSSSEDLTVKIWKMEEDKCECAATLQGHTEGVRKVIPIVDNRIASCSNDKTIKIWDRTTYECLFTLTGHTDWINCIFQIKTKDYLVSGASRNDSTLRFWNIKKDFALDHVIKDVKCCYWNSIIQYKDKLLVGGNKVISLINLKEFTVEKKYEDSSLGFVSSIILMPDTTFLCGCGNGNICQINIDIEGIIGKVQNMYQKDITSLVIIDRSLFASSSLDGAINVWQYS